MIPNYLEDVKQAAKDYPAQWSHAHVDGHPGKHDFILLLAARLHKKDPRVGCNGKRGNPLDLSMDALNVLDDEDGPGRTPAGKRCWVVDVIGGAGGSNPTPIWNAFSDPQASSGAWVAPKIASLPTPQYPPYPPNESDVDGAGVALFADFGMSGQPPNPQMFRFAFRVAYSWLTQEVPDLPASVAKHRKEWRAILGLPPL
jgi:hypothetical protein